MRPAAAISAILLCGPVAASAADAAGAGPADAFGRRIPPVSGQLYTKAGKVELTPTANFSVNDAFFSKYFFGAKLGYHFTEAWSLSASAVGGFARATGSTSVCPANQGCHAASTAQLYQVPGELRTVAGLEVGFSPVYGKLNVFAEKVVHFDLSLLAGGDWIRHREVLSATDAGSGVTPGTRNTLGGHVGVGTRLFFARSMALRLEVKDYLYTVPVLGSSSLQNQLFVELGLSFFFGGGR